MSRSFNLSLTLNFRAVFSEDDISEVRDAIADAREYVAYGKTDDKQRMGICKAILEAEPKGLDAVLSVFLKDTAKQFRQLVVDEVKRDNNFKDFAPAVLVITPRVNSGPKDPEWPCGKCGQCEACNGPCGGPRWTETV